eukprot:222671_1
MVYLKTNFMVPLLIVIFVFDVLSFPWDCYEITKLKPQIMQCTDTNGVNGIIRQTTNDYIHYFGNDISTDIECYELSINYTISNSLDITLYSYTYFSSSYSNSSWRNQCYGRKTPIWIPASDGYYNSVTTGRIMWPCASDLDCSLNGQCNISTGQCSCRPAWSSFRCDWLNILPGNTSWGLNSLNIFNNSHNNSWGGTVLRDFKTGQYNMFESEMANHCGLNSWKLMSMITHSTTNSINGIGQYIRKDTLVYPFAHEPDAIFSNNGDMVIYYSAQTYNLSLCNCTNATYHCHIPSNASFITYMTYINDIDNGNWSKPRVIFPARPKDTNFASVILNNGSLIGFSRTHSSTDPGSTIHLVKSLDWKDASKYIENPNDLFPDIPANKGTEDPFMYLDKNGYYHSIFHNRNPDNIEIYCGGHAYSMDGINWIYGGWSFNNTVQYFNHTTNEIYNVTWQSRERPHFIFHKDGYTPIAITSGFGATNGATWTGLFPVATNK